ncbi:hypothetical protein N7448_009944 [Penicillium atrosanguineum]|uniref:Phosphatidic acid phosphatase type 2/haloperoxidase domain-containing protein n=1 Tax=Penicillium atrosanguineum TaxID=1132637 RepID=A0A9W9PMC4_9EURO|nr:major facilitator superfamily transporter [Penicillium atrosanguineum]KAJ5119275.1 hypothetical protein N7448_009944 [Penicillium atrosanguineum]KAJ5296267.1 major facilitator superfamily transporter [Penicillium atrosanguineum]KAJ5299038.1 hypothetical protein N7476_010595 [Penicillium atrosanguineum]
MSPKDAIAHISKLLVLSYVVDWVFIVGLALIGYGFSKVTPNHHPFSLADPSISFPYMENETVTTETLVLVGLFAPAVIVLLGAFALVPGTAVDNGAKSSKSQLIRRKIWEWNAGWLGLALALAAAWTSTEGLKSLVGKPRPDLLARCNPDVSDIASHVVGGLGESLKGAAVLVDWTICRVQSDLVRVDAFSSFPSGHSSFSFAGLGYLTLWLASKFSVTFPYLPQYPIEGRDFSDDRSSVRMRGAAPPVLLMILAFVPTATACFIAASRWMDYRHHGFDILFGSALGIFFAYIGFRMYHLPIQRGAGWAWGPRGPRRAFLRGIGFPSSLGVDSWTYTRKTDEVRNGFRLETDVENVPMRDRAERGPTDDSF